MELEMLDGAGHAYDRTKIDRGELTPVFFGSASNNFGVQMLSSRAGFSLIPVRCSRSYRSLRTAAGAGA